MMRFTPIEQLGLKKYLDGTSDIHNDYKYEDFIKMVESGLNATNIAKAFKVDRRTIVHWTNIYEKT